MRGGGGLGMSSAADRGPAYTHLQSIGVVRSLPPHASPPVPQSVHPDAAPSTKRPALVVPRCAAAASLLARRPPRGIDWPSSPQPPPARACPFTNPARGAVATLPRGGPACSPAPRLAALRPSPRPRPWGTNLDTLDPVRAFAAPNGHPAWPFSRFIDFPIASICDLPQNLRRAIDIIR